MTVQREHPEAVPSPEREYPRVGRIVVFAGCMFAGKTTALIHELLAQQRAGKRIAAITHLLDLARSASAHGSPARMHESHISAAAGGRCMASDNSDCGLGCERGTSRGHTEELSAPTRQIAIKGDEWPEIGAAHLTDNAKQDATHYDGSPERGGAAVALATRLRTHDGCWFPAAALRSAEEIGTYACAVEAEIVGIDEAQFFDAGIIDICVMLRNAGRTVIAAGIHNNAWGRPFSPLPELMAVVDSVEIMTVPCGNCGAAAQFTQRVTPVIAGNMVGGPGDYEPRCAACFRPLPE